MSTQGPGRKRIPNREKLTGQEDALSQIAREAEARLAAKRVARAEAREFRMKELERLQLVYSHKKYYGLDYKWGHIEQWMEDSERYSGLSRRHPSISDDEERMSVGSRGSLRPSDHGGLLASGSRASSRASSARASPVVEERVDREFIDKSQGSRAASTLSTTTLASLGAASLGGASSRRGSCDTSFSVETEASIREMKDSLLETEEKYRRAMVTNAQLHNDKTALMFQVETLREELGDLEELLWESRRCCDLSNKELELERQAHKALQVQFTVTRETLRQTKELLMNHGISPDLINKDAELNEEDVNAESVSRLAEESPQGSKESIIGRTESRRPAEGNKNLQDLLEQSRISNTITTSNQTGQATERVNTSDQNEPISAQPEQKTAPFVPKEIWIGLDRTVQELQLKKQLEEKESLQEQVRLLQSQLHQKNQADRVKNPEEERLENGMESLLLDMQRDTNRQMSDLKFKLVKSEQEVTALEQNVIRLEGKVSRYKSESENAQKMEDELKVEKRRLQRELRWALERIGELESTNNHLSKRLEKMKANRNALLAQQ
ncbi:leucine-rich repeat flightless-interacting protein 2 isoform X7 [Nothobranchius furzeri]|uniref:leucine-rich repeat flightless-interacting protein 2 isoform X7 n=1 Tax=Nothobranchius furzeri TaxID=105023 RepID=UPI003904BACC